MPMPPVKQPQRAFAFPFVTGRRFSIEEAEEERGQKDWWRRGCFACFALIAGLLVIVGILVTQRTEIPYLYQVERGAGTVTAIGPIPPMGEPLDDTIRLYLRELILCLRWISVDTEAMQRLWTQTQSRMTRRGLSAFLAYQEVHKPLQQRNPVRVEFIGQPLKRGARTWDVQWKETRFDRMKNEPLDLAPVVYRALVTFETHPPHTPKEREHSPAGIFFDAWQWSKE